MWLNVNHVWAAMPASVRSNISEEKCDEIPNQPTLQTSTITTGCVFFSFCSLYTLALSTAVGSLASVRPFSGNCSFRHNYEKLAINYDD